MGEHASELIAASGWCSPGNQYLDLFDPAGLREWPAGLTPRDLDWLATMLWLGEIDPEPWTFAHDMPLIQVRRGGIRFPTPEGDPVDDQEKERQRALEEERKRNKKIAEEEDRRRRPDAGRED